MSDPKLPKAYSQYGASLGRRGSKGDPDEPWRFHLHRVYLDAGGYDNGGAYWGFAEPLYRAWTEPRDSDGDEVEIFLRAGTRALAKDKVRRDYPHATFYR